MVFILKYSGYRNVNLYPCYFVVCLLVIQVGFTDRALFEMRVVSLENGLFLNENILVDNKGVVVFPELLFVS